MEPRSNRCTQPDSSSTHLTSPTGGPRCPFGPPSFMYLVRIVPCTAHVRTELPFVTSTSSALVYERCFTFAEPNVELTGLPNAEPARAPMSSARAAIVREPPVRDTRWYGQLSAPV